MTEVTFRDRRSTLCALDVWTRKDAWQAQGIVRWRGTTEGTFRDRRSTLCVLDVWTRKDSWRAQGIVRLRGVMEVTFCERRSTLCALDVWTRKDAWQAQGIVRWRGTTEGTFRDRRSALCVLFFGRRLYAALVHDSWTCSSSRVFLISQFRRRQKAILIFRSLRLVHLRILPSFWIDWRTLMCLLACLMCCVGYIHGLIDPARAIRYEIATSHSIRARMCRSCIIVCRRLRFCLAPPSKKLADICLVFQPRNTYRDRPTEHQRVAFSTSQGLGRRLRRRA